MRFSSCILAGAAVLAAVIGADADAATVVAPNAYADQSGYEPTGFIFDNGSTADVTFQEGFDASQFGAIPIGAQITGIGYRLASNFATIADSIDYTDFTIQIGTPSAPIGAIGTSLDANQGADTITARSGAFTLPGNSLVNTGGLNPFYTIAFATPYTYTGGDVLVTTHYTLAADAPFEYVGLDAIDAYGVVNTLGGTDPAFLRTHFYNAPVVQFSFDAPAGVPEPTSWALMVTGFGLLGAAMRRRGALLRKAMA